GRITEKPRSHQSAMPPPPSGSGCAAEPREVPALAARRLLLRRLLGKIHRVLRDSQLLVGRDHEDLDLRVIRGDHTRAFHALLVEVSVLVDLDAEALQISHRILAHERSVLADTSGEGDRVRVTQDQHVRADEATQLVDVDLVGQAGVVIALVDQLLDLAEVVDTRDALQTGAPVEQVVDLVDLHATRTGQVEDHTRVDVTGTGTHDQTSQRGQTHGGIDRLAATDRRCRGTIAQVQGDLVDLLRLAAHDLRHRAGDELVARAVEAVAADVVLVRDPLVKAIVRRVLRQGGEERGIEDRDVRHVAQQGASVLNTVDIRWIVQRRQRDELLNLSDHLVVDEHRLGEGRTTVNDTVSNRDEVQVLRAAAQQGHHAECTLQTHRVRQDRAGVLHLRGGRGDLDVALRLANLLDDAG